MAARMKGHNQLPRLLVHLSHFLITVIWYFGRRGAKTRAKFSFFLFLERTFIPAGRFPSLQAACLPLAPATSSSFPLSLHSAPEEGSHQRWGTQEKLPSKYSHRSLTACSESSGAGGAGGARRAGVLPRSSLSICPSHRFSSHPVCSTTHLCSIPNCI